MADSRPDIMEENIDLAKAFAQRARADMKSAKELLKAGSYADSAYHAQQCAEKIVKSLLILENQVVRTHITSGTLKETIDSFEDGEWKANLQEVLLSLEDLERHWNLPRYPGRKDKEIWNPVEEYELEDAKDAIEKAQSVLNVITDFVEEHYHIKLAKSRKVSRPTENKGKNKK